MMQDFLPAEQATAFLELYKKKGCPPKTDSLCLLEQILPEFLFLSSTVLSCDTRIFFTHFLYLTNEVFYCKILSYGKNNLRYRS